MRLNKKESNVKRRNATALVMLLMAALSVEAQQNGTVNGAILETAKKGVGDAFVTLTTVPNPAQRELRGIQLTAVTAKDGSYRFTNVPAGDYRICAQVPGTKLVNPCDWGKPAVTVKVAAGATVDAGSLTLEEGYVLEVDVDDPQDLIALTKRRFQVGHLHFMVRGNGYTLPLVPTPLKKIDSQYSYVVPFDTDLEVMGYYGGFLISDPDAKSKAKNGDTLVWTVKFAKNDPPKPLKVAVGGVVGR